MVINRSRVEQFLNCPRKFYYQYKKRLVKPKRSPALRVGAASHKFWESWYTNVDWPTDERLKMALEAMREEFAKDRPVHMIELEYQAEMQLEAETEGLLRAYVRRWGTSEPFTVLEPELQCDAPLGNDHTLRIRPDGVIEYTNALWVLENKTTSQLGPTFFDKFYLNHQITAYVYGVAIALKAPISGAFVNVAKKSRAGNFEFDRQPILVQKNHIRNMLKSFNHVANDIASRDPELEDDWPQDTQRCHDYGKCPYWEICFGDVPAEVGPLYVEREPDYVEDPNVDRPPPSLR